MVWWYATHNWRLSQLALVAKVPRGSFTLPPTTVNNQEFHGHYGIFAETSFE